MHRLGFMMIMSLCLMGGLVANARAGDDKESVIQDLQRRIAAVKAELVAQEALVKSSEGSAQRAQRLLDMAREYAELADLQGLLAAERGQDKIYEAREMVDSRKRAIAIANRILNEHDDEFYAAKSLLFRAEQHKHLGLYEDFENDLRTLIARYPKSPRVADALLMMGDHSFDRANMDKAKLLYAKIESYPRSPLLGYARYKLAWVAVNQADYRRGMELFGKVAMAPIAQGQAGKAQRNLRLNALKDMVFCVTEVVPPDKTLIYMGRFEMSKEEQLWVLPALARRLWIKEQPRAALAVYDVLIPLADDPRDRLEWTERALELQEFMKNKP